jgi:two-component system nitrate/nitrite response regulator NarL
MKDETNPDPVGKCLTEAIECLREERARHDEEVQRLQEEIKVRDARIEELERTAQADELLLEAGEEAIHLTPRENDVLQLLRKGLQNKNIAHELGITESTVKVYVRYLMKKLNARNRTALAVLEHNKVRCKTPH